MQPEHLRVGGDGQGADVVHIGLVLTVGRGKVVPTGGESGGCVREQRVATVFHEELVESHL